MARVPGMPAAQSFNRVGIAPRAPDLTRAGRSSRGETKVNDGRREFPVCQRPSRLTAWATPRAHPTENARPDGHAVKRM
ncbi:hypothetical protein K227x_18520 [Rubripirellula lacrimiformis]|uniref:Uncharacterized protein n=1 Tax=Rubripirellula lacrimiformis TaxID=1930273 RepID=A0A517N8Z4_9BACT|nr:hypothetical protein K227x_18520 [Rubripirellula lacrimiformis]